MLPTIFLKLDFSKAYDKVSWRFLFLTMQKMRINDKFVNWVRLLFGNASIAINLNDSLGNKFSIKKGVRQGCPLAPYIFLIVEEVLTHIIKKAVLEGRIKGISLPQGEQQSILQYLNNILFMMRREKRFIDELVHLLKKNCDESGLEINREKFCAYWFDKYTHK